MLDGNNEVLDSRHRVARLSPAKIVGDSTFSPGDLRFLPCGDGEAARCRRPPGPHSDF